MWWSLGEPVMHSNPFKGMTVRALWLLALFLWPKFAWAATETVHMPITLDYSFLRSFFVNRSYTQPGEIAVPLEKDHGSTKIQLWDPQFSAEDSLLKFDNHIKINIGKSLFGIRTNLVDWEGYIEVVRKVTVDPQTSRLSFQMVDSRVYNQKREPVILATSLWSLVKTHVFPFLDQMSIDLSPTVRELKGFLPLLFPANDRVRIEQWLDTLRLGKVRVDQDAIRLDVLMDVESQPQMKEAAKPSLQETEGLAKTWQDWDAYSVYQIQSLTGESLTADERGNLLDTLLETRRGFLQALAEKTINRDLVGEQFKESRQILTPILRKHLVKRFSKSPLNYLAFFTFSDALAALQKLGPTVGVGIRRDGLVRLAKFLNIDQTEPALEYSYAVNPDLRSLLGFGPPLDDSGPAFDTQELDFPGENKAEKIPDSAWFWWIFWLPSAYASEAPPGELASILPWIPNQDSLKTYLDQIKQVIEQAATETVMKNKVEEKYQPFFRLLALATAWQESCWRQFMKAEGKVRYVVSYNQTSVGLMQVNECIWRGIYRPESLRWNIQYNVLAGIEILEQYLARYALRKMDPQNPLDFDTLARVVYAMYNGGPSEFKKFLNRHLTKTYYKSDELFWQKYILTKQGQFDKVFSSLTGY